MLFNPPKKMIFKMQIEAELHGIFVLHFFLMLYRPIKTVQYMYGIIKHIWQHYYFLTWAAGKSCFWLPGGHYAVYTCVNKGFEIYP